jgi:Protein of unknown function (DUF4019)
MATDGNSGCAGCFGCLGGLVVLTFIGSIFFGGGVLMRVAGFQFSLGNPVDEQRVLGNYLSDLEGKQKTAAEATQKFHTQLDQGKCKEIYAQASEMFKRNQREADLVDFCTKIRRKLGSTRSMQQIDWWGRPTEQASERYILIRYNTQFSKVSTQETFVWLVKNNKAELVSYAVS